MAQKRLTCDTIGDLQNGVAKAIIDAAIREVIADLDDRGADEKTRKVMIELDLTQREDGHVECKVLAQAKLPPRKTASTVGRVGMDTNLKQPVLLFQELASDNPDQRTFRQLDKDGGEVPNEE